MLPGFYNNSCFPRAACRINLWTRCAGASVGQHRPQARSPVSAVASRTFAMFFGTFECSNSALQRFLQRDGFPAAPPREGRHRIQRRRFSSGIDTPHPPWGDGARRHPGGDAEPDAVGEGLLLRRWCGDAQVAANFSRRPCRPRRHPGRQRCPVLCPLERRSKAARLFGCPARSVG